MGLAGDEIRLPLTEITRENRDRLRRVLEEQGFV
jgi:hypothetical protein